MLLIHRNLIFVLPNNFTYALSGRTWMFGCWLCTFSTVQSWVQIVSQNPENLLILLLPDSTKRSRFNQVPKRNSFKVSTITLSLLDESIHVPSIHCSVLYVHIVPYQLSDYMLIS